MTKKATKKPHGGQTLEVQNRKASHLYQILDTLEAGIVLTGSEVKSLRVGRANIGDAYARLHHGELWLVGANISSYAQASHFDHAPTASRKLLVHRKELARLAGAIHQEGMTVVPLKLYFKHGWAKVLLGLAKGKKTHDQRQDLKKREQRREMERAAKGAKIRI